MAYTGEGHFRWLSKQEVIVVDARNKVARSNWGFWSSCSTSGTQLWGLNPYCPVSCSSPCTAKLSTPAWFCRFLLSSRSAWPLPAGEGTTRPQSQYEQVIDFLRFSRGIASHTMTTASTGRRFRPRFVQSITSARQCLPTHTLSSWIVVYCVDDAGNGHKATVERAEEIGESVCSACWPPGY